MKSDLEDLKVEGLSIQRDKNKLSFKFDVPEPTTIAIKSTDEWAADITGNEIKYYEITVIHIHGAVGIGLTLPDFPTSGKMPGLLDHSYGYHSENGKKFFGVSTARAFGPTFGSDDTVGLGLKQSTGEVFATLNGKLVGSIATDLEHIVYRPTIGVTHSCEVSVNFKGPFKYDVKNFPKNLRVLAVQEVMSHGGVVLFLDGLDEMEAEMLKKEVGTVAIEYKKDNLQFYFAPDGKEAHTFRNFLGVTTKPTLVFFNNANKKKYQYDISISPITASSIKYFIKACKEGGVKPYIKSLYFPLLQALRSEISTTTLQPFFDVRGYIQIDEQTECEADFINSGGVDVLAELVSRGEELLDDAAMVLISWTVSLHMFSHLRGLLGTNLPIVQCLIRCMRASTRKMKIMWKADPVAQVATKNLAFIAAADMSRDFLVANGALDAAVEVLEKGEPTAKFGAMLAIANMIGTSETREHKNLVVSADMMAALLEGFRVGRYGSGNWPPRYLFPALRRLSINDNNKIKLVKMGVVPIWIANLQKVQKDDITLHEMLEMMLNLSVSDENNRSLIEGGVPNALKQLEATPFANPQHKKLISQILWKLEVLPSEKTTPLPVTPVSSTQAPSVMISYNWDDQSVVVELANLLKAEGFNIWLDLDNMVGSTIEAMAHAVETSHAVLVCFSRQYKESVNCRLEAEYAFRRGKTIIPLLMQAKYDADGWLGAIIGAKVFYDFTHPNQFQTGAKGVLKELKKLFGNTMNALTSTSSTSSTSSNTNTTNNNTTTTTTTTRSRASPSPSSSTSTVLPKPEATFWSCEQVSEWLERCGMEYYQRNVFKTQGMNGKALAGLADALRCGSPLWAHAAIQPGGTLGFVNTGDSLSFVYELKNLFP